MTKSLPSQAPATRAAGASLCPATPEAVGRAILADRLGRAKPTQMLCATKSADVRMSGFRRRLVVRRALTLPCLQGVLNAGSRSAPCAITALAGVIHDRQATAGDEHRSEENQ